MLSDLRTQVRVTSFNVESRTIGMRSVKTGYQNTYKVADELEDYFLLEAVGNGRWWASVRIVSGVATVVELKDYSDMARLLFAASIVHDDTGESLDEYFGAPFAEGGPS
jgi:hypothetical protein